MEPNIDFQMKVEDDLAEKLPPWVIGGVTVDIVVDHDKKTMMLVVSYNQFMTADADENIEKIIDFCRTVTERLKETCPAGWRII